MQFLAYVLSFAYPVRQENGGEEVSGGHIGAVLWLWRAHNAVTARLKKSEEGDTAFGDGMSTRVSKFPSDEACKSCYNASKGEDHVEEHSVFEYMQVRSRSAAPAILTRSRLLHSLGRFHSQISDVVSRAAQEVYCFESDTYVCSGFDDPSKAKEGRALPEAEKIEREKKLV